MKKTIILMATVFSCGTSIAQVSKTVVAEHFTNTYCSICASRNPGFYANRASFPQALHIAYHPSSPYTACPLNKHNKAENDKRTDYYGVYGATPRLVIQGKVLGSPASFSDPAIFSAELGQTTSFSMETTIKKIKTDSLSVSVTVKKVAASALSALELYTVLAEDTLFFAAANGENVHYDVFRKSVWGDPLDITAPVAVGDSLVFTRTIALDAAWVANRIYALAILQEKTKAVVQAARSGTLKTTTSLHDNNLTTTPLLYPNPSHNYIYLQTQSNAFLKIFDRSGKQVLQTAQTAGLMLHDLSRLPPGIYSIEISDANGKHYEKLVKE